MQPLKYERFQSSIIYDVDLFVKYLDTLDLNNKKSSFLLVNCDETRLNLNNNNNKNKKLDDKRRLSSNEVCVKGSKFSTFLPFHSHDRMLCSFFIFPMKNKYDTSFSIYKEGASTRSSIPILYSFNRSGYLDSELWLQIIKRFHMEMKIKEPNKKIIIFLDRLNIHMSDDTLMYCIQEGIDLIYFPVATTHILQPSDSYLFASFKKMIKKEICKRPPIAENEFTDIGNKIAFVAQKMVSQLSPSLIAKSWKETGIIPYSKKIIQRNLDNIFGKDKDENENEITSRINKMTTNIINDYAGVNKSSNLIKITPEKNRLYTGRELMLFKEKRRKKTSSTSTITITNEFNDDNQISNIEISDSNENYENDENCNCNCDQHKSNSKSTSIGGEVCDICHEFSYCQECFCNDPEGFFMHTFDCKPLPKKRIRNNKLRHEIQDE